MKSEIKTIEREIVTTTKVKENVINLTLTKKEFAIIQDALYTAKKHGYAKCDVKERAWKMFANLQPGGLTNNTWFYESDERDDTLFKE